jgi:hypothetical protein
MTIGFLALKAKLLALPRLPNLKTPYAPLFLSPIPLILSSILNPSSVQKTLLFWTEISCQEYAVSFKGISPGNS